MALGDKLAGNASASAVKAGEAFFEVNADDAGVMTTLKRLGNKINSFGAALKQTGLGIAGVGAAVLAPVVGLFAAAVKEGDALNDLTDRFDDSAEAITRLGYAAKLSDASLEDVLASTKAMNNAMIQAKAGSEDAAKIFDNLGVSADEFADIPIDEKFKLIANAADQIDDPIERAEFMMGLLGKQAITLAPLLKNGADGLEELFKEAEKVGAVKTGAQLKEAAELADAWDKTLVAVKSTLLEVGYAVFGMDGSLKNNSNTLVEYLKMARDWIKENKGTILTIAAVAAGVIALGGTLFILGTALSGIVAGFVAVKTAGLAVLTIVLTPWIAKLLILTALVGGVVYVLTEFTESGKQIKSVFSGTFEEIGKTFKVMFGGILDALRSGDLARAGQIGLLGLEIAWKEFNLGVIKSQQESGKSFTKTWIDVVDGMDSLFTDAVNGLEGMFKYLIGSIGIGLAQLTDELGITAGKADRLATELQQKMIAHVAKNKAELDAILDRNVAADRVIGDANKAEIAKAEAELAALKARLAALAKEAEEKPKIGILPDNKGHQDFPAIARLGDAARGTFRSADYKGSLAIGPASDFAKKNNDELKKIREELIKLNKKPGAVFN